jgi:hypothetical protein
MAERPEVALTLRKIVDELESALPAEIDGPRRRTLRLALEFGAVAVIWELDKLTDPAQRQQLLDALTWDMRVDQLAREIRDYCDAEGIPRIRSARDD